MPTSADPAAEWYYVGNYGQLGPLALDQMKELIEDGVIDRETYVWRAGMGDWRKAIDVTELAGSFGSVSSTPPPFGSPSYGLAPQAVSTPSLHYGGWMEAVAVSDKKRVNAAILSLIPGFGRFYLGYAAHGALQLLTAFLCGIGFIWSWVDGLIMLMGGIKYDGYGRVLKD